MTEQTNNRLNWSPDEQYRHGVELAARRAAWEEQKKLEAEQAERDRKRAGLESYLRQRAEAWVETVGTSPSSSVIQGWQQQYMDEQELVRQAERAAKLAAAEEHYRF